MERKRTPAQCPLAHGAVEAAPVHPKVQLRSRTMHPSPTDPPARLPRPACAILALAALLALPAVAGDAPRPSGAAETRGAYLAAIMDCHGCHTPGALVGKPDGSRALAGSEIGFAVPGLGIFYPPNLTSDRETGLGGWTDAEIARAITTGERPDGRILAPAMPWRAYAALTAEDALALAGYLASLPAVRNPTPPITGPGQPAPAPHFALVVPAP